MNIGNYIVKLDVQMLIFVFILTWLDLSIIYLIG